MLKNRFINSNTNKKYYTLDYHLKKKFKNKVGRIPINAGFTCPNIDGSKAFGGCTFCNTKGSGDFAGVREDSLQKQWDLGKIMMSKKWPNAKFIAYFQSFTNTYAPIDSLKSKYEFFIEKEDCIGISIGTRPDCLEEDVLDYLEDISKRTYLLVELGLQSASDVTGEIINRGHDLECFDNAVKELRQRNINVVVHIINGLPKETKEDMIDTVRYVSGLDIQGIKIHLLHVMSDTIMVNQLNNGFLKLLEEKEYIEIVAEQLSLLNKDVVVHRLTGDAPSDIFIGPIWSKKKTQVLNNIDKYLEKNDICQGDKYEKREL